MPAKNFASTRYSELAEINTENVAKLQVAFTFSMGVNKGQEAPPLVANETMYLVSPYPNILYALDLAKPGAPLKWQYAPKPEAAAQGVACCDVVNRGPVFSGGRLFYNTLDAGGAEIADIFAGRTGVQGGDRFAIGELTTLSTGSPVLASAVIAFDCRIVEVRSVGSHNVFFGAVEAVRLGPKGPALVYHERAYKRV